MNKINKSIPNSPKVYKPSAPFPAVVRENRRLTPVQSPDDIRHIVLDLSGSGISYLEGQSIGIIPPGTDENGKAYRVRLYSVSSSRKGDDGKDSTVSLTVKRVVAADPVTGQIVKGIASNYFCDALPGDEILITGPTGRSFFIPEDESVDIIMVAVGTGIAPFRAFIQQIYKIRQSWSGRIRLFFGTKTGMESLYCNDENNDIGQYFDTQTFKAFRALYNIEGAFIQRRVEENIEEIWRIIRDENFSFYICGLKELETGIEEILNERARQDNLHWEELRNRFKEEGRWNVEVY